MPAWARVRGLRSAGPALTGCGSAARGASRAVRRRGQEVGTRGRWQGAGTPGRGAQRVPDLGERLAVQGGCRRTYPQVWELLQVPEGWSSSSTNKTT